MKPKTTKERIDELLEYDNGRLFRHHLKNTIAGLSDAFDETKDELRSHLGASLIGDPCARKLWLTFRFATSTKTGARLIRLFNRGHLEEARFEALLRMIGCEIWTHDANGKQFRFRDCGGHFCGSLDAVVRGIPECPDIPVLCEFKTHNDKSFQKLEESGVLSSKEQHWVQMQVYMKEFGLTKALYMAVNKNSDELYTEIIPANPEIAQKYIDRANKIIFSENMPPKLNESPGWWQCRFCFAHDFCHLGIRFKFPYRTCRPCAYLYAVDGGWECRKDFIPQPRTFEEQLHPCKRFRMNPWLKGCEI